MSRTRMTMVVAGLMALMLTWNFANSTKAAPRQTQRVPGPGTGAVTVNGTVDVALRNPPPVTLSGAWKVNVEGTPDVRVTNQPTVLVAPPSFVKAGGRYQITWGSGETEDVRVTALGGAGWVQVATEDRSSRWINVTLARGIVER